MSASLYFAPKKLDEIFDFMSSSPSVSSINPKYNAYSRVENGENQMVYELVIPGFTDDELEIRQEKSKLFITGKPNDEPILNYTYRQYTKNDFKYTFNLLEYYVVSSVSHADGILTITTVEKLPDYAKPIYFKPNSPQVLLE